MSYLYLNIISAFVTEAKCIHVSVNTSTSSDEASAFPLHCKD